MVSLYPGWGRSLVDTLPTRVTWDRLSSFPTSWAYGDPSREPEDQSHKDRQVPSPLPAAYRSQHGDGEDGWAVRGHGPRLPFGGEEGKEPRSLIQCLQPCSTPESSRVVRPPTTLSGRHATRVVVHPPQEGQTGTRVTAGKEYSCPLPPRPSFTSGSCNFPLLC